MEIRHLRYFIKVAEELNFSKAAEKLFISQPPLSRQIRELEDEIGTPLFERNNKTVRLTNAGKYFKSEVEPLIEHLERVTTKTQKIGNNISGEFRIAYISSTFSGVISELIQHLSELYPYANFKLYEFGTSRQIELLESNKLDLGILRAPVFSSKVKTRLWYKDGYALVYNKTKVTINSEDEMASLANLSFVFFNKDFAPHYYNSLLEICSQHGFTPNFVHESNNINSIIQLVRHGLGVSIVPATLMKSHAYPEINFIPIKKFDLFTEILIATPRNEDLEIANAAIDFLLNAH